MRLHHVLPLVALAACPLPEPIPPTIPTDIFAPLGEVLPSATDVQKATFVRGQAVARKRYSPAEGLGPAFNVDSCVSCHEKPVLGGAAGRYRNFLLVGQRLPDGSFTPTGKNGVQDHYAVDGAYNPTAATANVVATRNPIPFFGTGLLAEIPDSSILAHADPDDANHDGISGRVNYDRGFVGRFGMKSQTVSIEGFIRGPLFNHLGLTSNPLPDALRATLPVPSNLVKTASRRTLMDGLFVRNAWAQAAAPDSPTVDTDGVPDPELAEADLYDLVSFCMLTAAPQPDPPTEMSAKGEALFLQAKCDACHVPTLRSKRGLIPVYSDLLVHDMGDALADGIVMKDAKGNEFRTAPLWGVAAAAPYLHDGRADTLEQAILLHEGEGKASRDVFQAFTPAEQAAVVAFLESLGGASQKSAGMLPPNAPVPEAGAFGGPLAPLSETDRETFVRGRQLFDSDTFASAGLGTTFNGDSCRACHFDPTIGGAGPSDVDVIRQAIFENGVFREPTVGTMLHRHGRFDARPAAATEVTYFERRQTPPLFGLGLIDRIPEAEIRALADPDDANGDGIKGRVAVLSDGRIGRFGWKNNVPSIREFVRDAMSNELGLSVADQEGATFGNATDLDAIADPELGTSGLQDVAFFLTRLAPPPRTRTDNAKEDAGATVFTNAGCAACHAPSMATSDGETVALYSDLLLHDVAPPASLGLATGAAGIHDFRTTPLWGLSKTAPYLHDGSAFTIEAAIEAHEAEGEASRAKFRALGAEDRAALMAFLGSI